MSERHGRGRRPRVMLPETGDLRTDMLAIDRRPYPAYKDLKGRRWSVGAFSLELTHVQGDPFAAPSRVTVRVAAEVTGLADTATRGVDACRAAADYLHRSLGRRLDAQRRRTGSGKSGLLEILPVGPEVLSRSAFIVDPDGGLEIRLAVGLPAQGRRILGRAAGELLAERLPEALSASVTVDSVCMDTLTRHVDMVLDQVALRSQLAALDLIAFIADGSILPRRSGISSRPLDGAIPFEAPESLAVTLDTPHAGALRGMGIRRGVTLIVGGGYHGKSTLLSALATGVYDHVPGDGRERCVCSPEATCIRAEDGRAVRGVDLRPFIGDLPLGRTTVSFESDDASGSTSQAAAIIEALEVGATTLLIDEDTAATNFMIRDPRMRALVPGAREPITPFLDRVRQLYEEQGVSSVLVVGGAGDYLDVADTVIMMTAYRSTDATLEAQEVAAALPRPAGVTEAVGSWPSALPRVPEPGCLDPSRGRRAERVRSVKTRSIEFGEEEIDVALLAQLVDPAQCRMIGDALLAMAREGIDGERTMSEVLDWLESRLADQGLGRFTPAGDRASARRLDIAAALNRTRSLRIRRA